MTELAIEPPVRESAPAMKSPRPGWAAWARYQAPYAAHAYAYFPITLTKRVLLRPRAARHDLMVRRFWDRWGWLPDDLEQFNGAAPVWVHMNSGGEAIMAQAVLQRLEAAGHPCYVSSDSYDAQGLLRQRFGPQRVLFPPWDTGLPVNRVIRRTRPKALMFVLNAYFPMWLAAARRQGIPTILINGLLSRNVGVANRFMDRAMALGAYRALDGAAVQSEADADALRRLGMPADRVVVTGKLEGDLRDAGLSPAERGSLRRSLGVAEADRVLVAGSVPLGEVKPLCDALRQLRARVPSARLLLAPRWLHEAQASVKQLRAEGFAVSLRSAGSGGAPFDVLVIDTFGELRTLYGAGDAAFIGSSLAPINERKGGHNVLEPAAHGVPAFFGPHMNLWHASTGPLLDAWPGLQVDSAAMLGERVAALWNGEAPLPAIRQAGRCLIERDSGAVERTVSFLGRWLGGLS